MKRLVVAFAVAPLVASLLFAVSVSIVGFADPGGHSMLGPVIFSFPIWVVISLPVSYAVGLGAGIPAFLIFRRAGWLAPSKLALGASGLGALVGIAVAFIFTTKPIERTVIEILFTAFGAACGLVFWRLGIRSPVTHESNAYDAA